MASTQQIEELVNCVPVKWRNDFLLLISGRNPSSEFIKFFDSSLECQQDAERILRHLDGDAFNAAKNIDDAKKKNALLLN